MFRSLIFLSLYFQATEVAEMVRSFCELGSDFTGRKEEWEGIRALLELGCFFSTDG